MNWVSSSLIFTHEDCPHYHFLQEIIHSCSIHLKSDYVLRFGYWNMNRHHKQLHFSVSGKTEFEFLPVISFSSSITRNMCLQWRPYFMFDIEKATVGRPPLVAFLS